MNLAKISVFVGPSKRHSSDSGNESSTTPTLKLEPKSKLRFPKVDRQTDVGGVTLEDIHEVCGQTVQRLLTEFLTPMMERIEAKLASKDLSLDDSASQVQRIVDRSEQTMKTVVEQAVAPLTGLRKSVAGVKDVLPEVVRVVGLQQKKLDAMHQDIEQVTNATIEVGQVKLLI